MGDRKIPTEYMEHLSKQGFDLQEKIGSGLSGGVYRATQPSLGRDVAVKFFDNSLSLMDDSLRQRFEREARILAKLQHPSIPFVITRGAVKLIGTVIPYTVMQFINGQTLDLMLKREGKLDVDISVQYVRQILSALYCAHNNKIVHRDIKPSNIMVMPSDHCYVIDFSIGVSLDTSFGFSRATHSGEHIGSIDYIAPEQTRDMKTVDHRADIYSLGLVLYEILTGRLDKTSFDKSLSHLPIALKNAVKKACEFDPNDRFQTAEEFLRSIRGLVPNRRMINDRPGTALCLNLKCPDAKWSSRGYYKGPTIIESCTDHFLHELRSRACIHMQRMWRGVLPKAFLW